MGYDKQHRNELWSWINRHGITSFWGALAELAADRIRELSAQEDLSPTQKMVLKQWTRTHTKLEALAEWCEEFGPGTDCR